MFFRPSFTGTSSRNGAPCSTVRGSPFRWVASRVCGCCAVSRSIETKYGSGFPFASRLTDDSMWAHFESSVNLDANGNPDPYFVSIDLLTAQHPQTLLATHLNGEPLTVEHGAPLRLLVPVKLGLKNIKAITRLTYVAQEPRDYWAERGYSHYDGV